jgi:hypothetical protein
MSPFPDQGTKLKTVVVITFALYSEKTDVSDGVRVARSFQLPTGAAKVAKSLDGWLHPVLRHPAGEQRQYCIIARSFSVERCLFFQFVKFEAFHNFPATGHTRRCWPGFYRGSTLGARCPDIGSIEGQGCMRSQLGRCQSPRQ